MEFPGSHRAYNKHHVYKTTPPSTEDDYMFKLRAKFLPDGKTHDHFEAILCGTNPLFVAVDLEELFPSPRFRGWRYQFRISPGSNLIERYTMSTAWTDPLTTLARREASILNDTGALVSTADFITLLNDLRKTGPEMALRFYVAASRDRELVLQLQGLPLSIATPCRQSDYRG